MPDLLNSQNVIPAKDIVLLKPNVLSAYKPEHCVTTHPSVVEGVIRYLKNFNVKIIIAESSVIGIDTMQAFQTAGYKRLSEKYNVDLVDMNTLKRMEYKWKYGQLQLPEIIENADIFNIAKMKTHVQTTVTLCHKNLKGFLNSETKKRFHREKELNSYIKELSKLIRPFYNIVDGIMAIEGNGPGRAGRIKRTDLIVMGRDIAEVDSVCLKIMGISADLIEHFDVLENIDTNDEKFKNRLHSFKLPDIKNRKLNTYFWSYNACSACINNTYDAIRSLKRHPVKLLKFMFRNMFSSVHFIMGSGKCEKRKNVYCIGNCALKNEGIKIKGCPPSVEDILKKL